jgi:hypothetical protein
MKKSLSMLFVVLFVAISANVFGATDMSMITSQAKLRQYALDLVTQGSRSVGGNFDWNYPGVTYTNTTGGYAEDVLKKLFSAEFSYKLVNSNDTVNGYVWLYDKNWTLIFFGSAYYKLDDLKVAGPKYNVWMQDIPLPLTDVQSAEVLALGADGITVNRNPLNISPNGQPLFPAGMAGATNGLMVVRFNNGDVVTYDLASASSSVPSSISESAASYQIDGHYVFETKPGSTNEVKVISLWNEPTVFLDIKSASPAPVIIDVTGIYYDNAGLEYERPYALVFKAIDSDQEYTVDLDTTGTSLVEFPPGPCRILFKWKNFGQKPTLYTGPYYSTGGGKG